MMKIIIIDDHLLTGQTMEMALTHELGAHVLSFSPENFDYDLLYDCDLLLLDYDFGDFGNAYDVLKIIDEKKMDHLKIILFSTYWQPQVLMACHHSLIWGYINKIDDLIDLYEAVKAVMDGKVWYSSNYASEIKRIMELPKSELLTPRELEIIKLKRLNYSREDIAKELEISINTVRNHMSRIFKKLGINSSKEL